MTDYDTISVYNSQVDQYAELIKQQPADPLLLNFIARFKAADLVLDLGCGPAQSSAIMREHGLRVDPTDASAAMVKLANSQFNIDARQAVFEEVNAINSYDGIWANFSLLHASQNSFSKILSALHRALKPDGLFLLRMKLGTGENRDKLGRFYSYYSQQELVDYLSCAGFSITEIELGEALGLAGELEPWVAITSNAG